MKHLIILPLILISLVINLKSLAQNTPNLFNYQAVAHDANGDLLVNQNLTIRIGVLSGSSTGTLEYEEDQSVTTNDYGLFSIQIGNGSSTGNGSLASFGAITWSNSSHFLSVDIDAGNGFESLGTMQLVSVPYALNSKNTEQIQNQDVSNLTPNDGDIMVFNSIAGQWEYQANTGGSSYTAGTGISITGTTIDNTGDVDGTDDITTSTSAGGDLTGTYPSPTVTAIQGNAVITGTPNDGDVLIYNSTSSQWEYSAPSSTETTTTLVDNFDGTFTYTSEDATITTFDANIDDADADPVNELVTQFSLNGSNDSLILQDNGNRYAIALSSLGSFSETTSTLVDNGDSTFTYTDESSNTTTIDFAVNDADADFTNELVNLFSINGSNDSLILQDNGSRFAIALTDIASSSETTTTLVDNLDGTFTYTSEDATTTTFDANIDDADADPTNEYNTSFALNGSLDSLVIQDAGTYYATALTDINTAGADEDPTNEYNTSFALNGALDSLVIQDAGTYYAIALTDINIVGADEDPTNEYNTSFALNGALDSLVIQDAGTYFAVALTDIAGTPLNIYIADGVLTSDRTVTQGTNTMNFDANSTNPVATFSNAGFTGANVDIDATNAGSPSSITLLQQGTTKGQLVSTTNGMRIYGAAGIPRIGINTDPSSNGILQIQHAGSNTDPGIYMSNPNNGVATGLNRITMANTLASGKYWEMAGGVNTGGDDISAWTVSYDNGTTYNQLLAVYGDKKIAVGNISATNSSTFDVFGSTTLHDSLTIDDGSSPYTFPTSDGTANYVMQTNGSGSVSWVDPSSFGSSGWSLIGNASTIPGTNTGGGESFLGTIDASDLLIATNSTPAIWVNGLDQNVGIGTTTPLGKLHIITENATNLLISHTKSNNNVDDAGSLQLLRSRLSGTSEAEVLNGDRIGTISFNGYNSGAFNYGEAGYIAVYAAEDYNSTGNGGRMTLNTSPLGGGTPQEAIVITSSQFVGIGDLAPSATLDVNGTFQYTDGNEAPNYVLTTDAAGNATWAAPAVGSRINDLDGNTYIETDVPGDGSEDFIHFATNGVERLSINNIGNIGINTTSPNNKLSIVTDASNGFEMQTYGNGNTNMISFIHYGGVIGSPTLTTSGDIIGTSMYSGYGVTTNVTAAKIEVIAEANFTDGSAPGSIVFGTTPTGSNAPIERMRVSTNGNVGIGSTNPAVKLDVNGDVGISNDNHRIMRLDEGADLVPVAYGVINDGVLQAATSTSNVTVNKIGPGQYQVTYSGPRTFNGSGEFQLITTPYYQGTTLVANYQYLGGTTFEIFLTDLSDVLTDGIVSFTLRVK